MKLISLSIIVACTGAVFAIPGGQLKYVDILQDINLN